MCYLKYAGLFFVVALFNLNCSTTTTKKEPKARNNQVVEDPEIEEYVAAEEPAAAKPRGENAKVKRAYAEYVAPGAIIKAAVPIKMIYDYDLKGNKTALTMESCQAGFGCFKFISNFDEKDRESKVESFNNGVRQVFQENKYDARDNLLSEFRIETEKGKSDTTHYVYHYDKSNVSYRTNNGDTVSRFTVNQKGNKTIKLQEIYPPRDVIANQAEEITKNGYGQPIKHWKQIVSSGWASSRGKMDTSIYLNTYKYNSMEQLIEETEYFDEKLVKTRQFEYQDGAIYKIHIIDKGRSYTVDFEHSYW